MEELLNDYIEKNEVTFKMIAVNGDGETLIEFDGENSFDDVAGYAGLADEAFLKLVQEDEEARLDLIASNEADRGY